MQKTADRRSTGQASGHSPWLVRLALLALLAFGVALHARAQQSPDEVDPPDRAARLSEVIGQVWLYSPDSNEWLGVARNRPLTTGDRIATDKDARAEVTLGSTTLRLDAATELEIVLLDDSRFALHLHRGSVAARVRSAQALPEFEMNTDEGRFRLQVVGRYRFDRLDQASEISVMSGQAVFEAGNSALPVYAGQHAQFWLDAAGAAQYSMVQTVRDAFASWNDDRDSAEDRVAANRYVSPEMTGAGDLERYGRWEQTTDYGPIWQPTAVPSGWAPYSTGHWAWIRPWGWTWVDDAPWGFAPFHYGRWVYHRNAWCWAPGAYVRRPVYAPALVAWMGGPRVGVSVSIGGGGPPVGWFPLAPREVYVPSYRTSSRYVRSINLTHVTNVTVIDNHWRNRNEPDRRDFANRKFPHAVTVVPQSVLTGRQPVAPVAGRLRNDPQVRAMLSDGRSFDVQTASPIAMPQAETRRGEARPRAPFEARAPGFVGRPDSGRPEGTRPEGRRVDGQDGRDPRPGERGSERGGGRPGERPVIRAEDFFGRPMDRPGERTVERPGERSGDRREQPGQRGGERGRAPAPPAVVGTSPIAPAAPSVVGGAAPPVSPAAPPVLIRPPSGMSAGGDAPAGRGQRGGPREPTLNDAAGQPRGMAPPPWQRGATPSDEAGGRPGFSARERRSPPEGAAGEGRSTRPGGVPSGSIPSGAIPSGAPPRGMDSPRAAEAPRAVERPAPAPRGAEAARPAAPQAPAAQAAPAAQPAPVREAREPRMGRPEPPRDRDEGRRGQSERAR